MQTLSLATWNINSVRLRIEQVVEFLKIWSPDVLALQETKCPPGQFPTRRLREIGYEHVAECGQKGYHGVAIVSRHPLEDVESRSFCGMGDARHVCATVRGVRVHSLYVPAGGELPDPDRNPKFAHKLAFLAEMREWLKAEATAGGSVVLMGDLNVAPYECDVWDHRRLLRVVTHTPVETDALKGILAESGLVDVVRRHIPAPRKVFTWWSYRGKGDWNALDKGRRLDHVWTDPELAEKCSDVEIVRATRGWTRPSDHVPVVARFGIEQKAAREDGKMARR